MSHNAPVKSTSGAGFGFEEQVGAYLACQVLAALPFPDESAGKLVRLDFQARADGWFFDDVVAIYAGEGGRCGFSIKSNRQIKSTGAAKDLVQTMWRQLLGETNAPFDEARDRLGLLASTHPPEIGEAMAMLTATAREQDNATMDRRMKVQGTASATARKIYHSFYGAPELATTNRLASRALGRFVFAEFDFDRGGSTRRLHALQICRSLLDDESESRASGYGREYSR